MPPRLAVKVFQDGEPVGFITKKDPLGFKVGPEDEAVPFLCAPVAEDAGNALFAQLKDAGKDLEGYMLKHITHPADPT